MANITVSPTRMELTRLKGKLKTAQRGHKLLKDKRDELMKQFLDTVREVRSLRAEVEEDLMRVHKSFTVASALMSSEALEQALLYPKQSVELTRTTQNIMSVNVPVYDFQTKTKSDSDISRPSRKPASGRSSTAPSPSRLMVIRWSARCAACPVSGSPVASWPVSARAAAWGWPSPTG